VLIGFLFLSSCIIGLISDDLIGEKEFAKREYLPDIETVIGINESDKGIYEDNRFTTFKNGIVRDRKKGLEWIAGSDRRINWYMAKKWVYILNEKQFKGGNWRMPTITELKTIEGPAHLLLRTEGLWVWSCDAISKTSVRFFLFDYNFVGFNSPSFRDHRLCAFAVRSRK
jgi:hypothetical protein